MMTPLILPLDGILVNQKAMEFAHSCQIVKDVGFQHARVVLEFNFPTQKRMCWTWQAHAAMNLSKLKPMEDRPRSLSNCGTMSTNMSVSMQMIPSIFIVLPINSLLTFS